MTRLSYAQSKYLQDVLQIDSKKETDLVEINKFLEGMIASEYEKNIYLNSLKLAGNGEVYTLNRLDKFANGHLFTVIQRM